MDSRVVQPDTDTLHISRGDWLLVKKRLTSGENRKMIKRGAPFGGRVDLIEAGMAKVLAFLIDWSVKDPKGVVVPIRDLADGDREAAIDSIDPDSYTEVLRAIEAHEAAMQAERDAQKKILNGDKPSSTRSPLPWPADSPTPGSNG